MIQDCKISTATEQRCKRLKKLKLFGLIGGSFYAIAFKLEILNLEYALLILH